MHIAWENEKDIYSRRGIFVWSNKNKDNINLSYMEDKINLRYCHNVNIHVYKKSCKSEKGENIVILPNYVCTE